MKDAYSQSNPKNGLSADRRGEAVGRMLHHDRPTVRRLVDLSLILGPPMRNGLQTPLANSPIGPEVLYWALKHVQSLRKAKEIFIAENGCAGEDVVAEDGRIYDTDRIMFVRAFLTELQRATADGVPVKGFTALCTSISRRRSARRR